MSKRRRNVLIGSAVAVAVLGVAAATAGPVLYRDLVVGPAAVAPSITAAPESPASEGEEAATGLDLASLPTSWTVAGDSYAGYRVDEVLNGTDVTVVGRTKKVSGEVETSGTSLERARIVVPLRSIATNEPARDAYFRDSAIDTQEHPDAVFTLSEPVEAPPGTEAGEVVDVEADGTMELNGRSQDITVDLQARVTADSAQVTGSVPITFADYGVTAPDLGFVKVEKEGSVEFSLELRPAD